MDFCPFIQQGLVELTKTLGRVVHTSDYTAKLIPNMFYRVTVSRPLKEIKDYLCMVRCGVIVLVAVVIPEMLLGKWHYGVLQKASVELTGEVFVREGKRRFGTIVKSSPDVYQTTTSLDPISLVPLLEALTR